MIILNKIGDGKMNDIKATVKLIEKRARAKAQNDYLDKEYPANACVPDFNQCYFIFNDTSTLLRPIKLFVNKVSYYQSGHIIGIVRDNNGFSTDGVNNYRYDYNKLINWDIQDVISNGIVSQSCGATSNSPKFYHHDQHLFPSIYAGYF